MRCRACDWSLIENFVAAGAGTIVAEQAAEVAVHRSLAGEVVRGRKWLRWDVAAGTAIAADCFVGLVADFAMGSAAGFAGFAAATFASARTMQRPKRREFRSAYQGSHLKGIHTESSCRAIGRSLWVVSLDLVGSRIAEGEDFACMHWRNLLKRTRPWATA